LDNAAACAEMESDLPQLMETLNFYIEQAELSDV
jgi:hypothetical protein